LTFRGDEIRKGTSITIEVNITSLNSQYPSKVTQHMIWFPVNA